MLFNKLSVLSRKVAQSLRLGTVCCNEESLILMMLNKATPECFNSEELKRYKDIIHKHTYDCSLSVNRVTIDDSNRSLWEESNPECISRKEWERIALKICNKYSIDISVTKTEQICYIAFDITKDILNCDVIASISVQQKMCDYNIDFTTTKSRCNAEYKIILEKHPNCEITKKEYYELVNTGYSFEVISNIYSKGFSLEVDSTGRVNLIGPTTKYTLSEDLKFKDIILTSSGDLQLPDRILNDYNISNKIKKQILDEINLL